MKKFIAAALFSVSLLGYAHADDPLVPAPAPAGEGVRSYKALAGVDGNLAGQIYEIEAYSKLFVPAVGSVNLGQNGGKAGEAKVGPGGVFQLQDVAPGRYTFVVNTPQGFATFGQYVDLGNNGANPIGVEAGLVPTADFAIVREIAMSTPSSGLDADGGDVIPAQVAQEISNFAAFGVEASGLTQGYLTIPGADSLRAADGMTVWFVRDGQTVASGETDQRGLFQVNGLTPGWYTLIASGKYGFMAVGAEVLPVDGLADSIDVAAGGNTSLVWVKSAGAGFSPGSAADLALIRSLLPAPGGPGAGGPLGQMAPAGGGGGGFGASGGGLGGGGLGGLGALLGAAGLGLGIAALVDDDKKVIISPPGP